MERPKNLSYPHVGTKTIPNDINRQLTSILEGDDETMEVQQVRKALLEVLKDAMPELKRIVHEVENVEGRPSALGKVDRFRRK